MGTSGGDSLIIKNTGVSPLVISNITGSNNIIFPFTNISPDTITTGDSAFIGITFTPTDYIEYAAQLVLSTNIGSKTIPLFGSGIRPGNDAGVIALASPLSGCALGDTNTVRILIRNFGSNAQSGFNVGYSVNGGTPVIENIGSSVIPAGAGKYYSFNSKAGLHELGSYAIKVFTMLNTDVNRLNDTLASVITNYPALQVTVTPNQTLCLGNEVTLNAAAVQSTFTWNTGSTNAYIIVSPEVNTSYTVTALSDNGCTATDTIRVTVLPLPAAPVITANGNTTICSYNSITLSSNISGVKWNTGSSQQQITVKKAGTYNATVTDGQGCSASSNNINVSIDIDSDPRSKRINYIMPR